MREFVTPDITIDLFKAPMGAKIQPIKPFCSTVLNWGRHFGLTEDEMDDIEDAVAESIGEDAYTVMNTYPNAFASLVLLAGLSPRIHGHTCPNHAIGAVKLPVRGCEACCLHFIFIDHATKKENEVCLFDPPVPDDL